MNKNEALTQFLTGQIDSRIFYEMIESDLELQSYIAKMVPQEAIDNRTHLFWENISFDALKNYGFNALKLLHGLFRFDGSLEDTLNIFSILQIMYRYYFPDLPFTDYYNEAFDLYLDVAQDCFEGPEVKHITESIVNRTLSIKPKKRRIQTAKLMIREAFHVTDRERPRWIQGPEWPMGQSSPMKFLKQKREKEKVLFLFKDVEDGSLRTVIQFY